MNILVLNSGSSSIKYQLLKMPSAMLLAVGQVERIDEVESRLTHRRRNAEGKMEVHVHMAHIRNHRAGLVAITELLVDTMQLTAIGHRVVHAGEAFSAPIRIDAQVIEILRGVSELAPLHNPANLAGIEVCLELFPDIQQVAVFDTAFHQGMPAHAYRYALPNSLYSKHGVRRYGFHGTSHTYVARQAALHLQKPLETLNLISLHLGNGASAAAIHGGRCIDTSMGMTPLEGLMMGTRCGDIDPAVAFYLQRVTGQSSADIESLYNHDSGLKGICGENDMREVLRMADAGDNAAQLAIDMYCYRIKKYIGAYLAALGRIDGIIFTAGIGENAPRVRQLSCHGLEALGIVIDENRNVRAQGDVCEIQSSNANIKLLVVRTNEELEIARQTVECIEC
ncbi:acetate/propionate family kinase [Nitrosomonas aestuarii]|uniref:acetate/propionate family kinase n=1 Tax=Nitrosomonas aestuarii TaxID=52441 RepID=UPI000D30DE38|nr:acetate kinase [Nitrosomonas aestuarii]PTN11820.1 acetate kinase [Nitrosomonas aestuarii]